MFNFFFLPEDFNPRLPTFCVHKRAQITVESFTWCFLSCRFSDMGSGKSPLGNSGQRIST